MKTLFMTKGLPASGKTTWAKKMVEDNPGAYKRVNKDDLRAMIDCGRWSGANEKFILAIRDQIISTALIDGKHAIVDDTNLSPKHESRLRELAHIHGAVFQVIDFTHVPVEECIKRDSHRHNYVGEEVIRKMWTQFLKPPMPPAIERDPSLPDCVIVDIDGTLAQMNGRGPFDWHKVSSDLPHSHVCDLVALLRRTYSIIFISGRDACCREETKSWLATHTDTQERYVVLHMRPEGDIRDDRIIKREIYENEIRGKYNVIFVLDDRNKVVEQWRQMGIACFQVAEGNF